MGQLLESEQMKPTTSLKTKVAQNSNVLFFLNV